MVSGSGVPDGRASCARSFAVADPQTATVDLLETPGLDVETHFEMVPEWLLDSPISDCALRLYAVFVRYGQTSGGPGSRTGHPRPPAPEAVGGHRRPGDEGTRRHRRRRDRTPP